MPLFPRLFRTKPLTESALAPQRPFFAIGDVHGCADRLDAALGWIAARPEDTEAPVVLLGDCIDRGPNSAAVLHRLFSLHTAWPDLICLRGNHEEMLLGFLDDPVQYAPMWLGAGGTETLQSFGLTPTTNSEDALYDLRDALAQAMGVEMIQWMLDWPWLWQSGNIIAVHAGLDPTQSPDAQDPAVLTWGNADCYDIRRKDGLFVLHGHLIVDRPGLINGRIAIDSGVYATGALTVARVEAGGLTLKTIDQPHPDAPQTAPPLPAK
ncbi:metallophosphoesterase [Shimia sp. R9_3]|uniref:metallophosphoesterase n=1 Tax=Shimia sp. R9_3 TaxID=2821113 RepID=UPI001ADC159D|nr:metallophosphoesterase [Shimia sp. R9_3]MBO9402199.1 serine/threonine protein phosphatase [Shimia sp. R9_3]